MVGGALARINDEPNTHKVISGGESGAGSSGTDKYATPRGKREPSSYVNQILPLRKKKKREAHIKRSAGVTRHCAIKKTAETLRTVPEKN